MDETSKRPLELDDLLPGAPFRECHRRLVEAPIADVWPAALDVTVGEVRALGPLATLRELPARLSGRSGADHASRPLLDAFTAEGFVPVRRDAVATDGRATVLFCTAGRFWSPVDNAAIPFDDVDGFLDCQTPGIAKTAFDLRAIDRGQRTEVTTETRIVGTDRAATRRFAMYWALIRAPSGLIRRSWLAAIARRATAARAEHLAGPS